MKIDRSVGAIRKSGVFTSKATLIGNPLASKISIFACPIAIPVILNWSFPTNSTRYIGITANDSVGRIAATNGKGARCGCIDADHQSGRCGGVKINRLRGIGLDVKRNLFVVGIAHGDFGFWGCRAKSLGKYLQHPYHPPYPRLRRQRRFHLR